MWWLSISHLRWPRRAMSITNFNISVLRYSFIRAVSVSHSYSLARASPSQRKRGSGQLRITSSCSTVQSAVHGQRDVFVRTIASTVRRARPACIRYSTCTRTHERLQHVHVALPRAHIDNTVRIIYATRHCG